MDIGIKTGKSIKDLSILNTYAPHIGYPVETIRKYWGNAEANITLFPRKCIRLWRTDNNGQLSSNGTNATNIWPCAAWGELNSANSTNLINCCEWNDWVSCNTFPHT